MSVIVGDEEAMTSMEDVKHNVCERDSVSVLA